jgi:hypothetical protein
LPFAADDFLVKSFPYGEVGYVLTVFLPFIAQNDG